MSITGLGVADRERMMKQHQRLSLSKYDVLYLEFLIGGPFSSDVQDAKSRSYRLKENAQIIYLKRVLGRVDGVFSYCLMCWGGGCS